jgi:pyoverdine/dityrosine biosynthesis protein Dit1
MANERYNILCNGRRIFSSLSEEEYFDTMEDLSIQFYQTGTPRPEELETEILLEDNPWLQKQKAD